MARLVVVLGSGVKSVGEFFVLVLLVDLVWKWCEAKAWVAFEQGIVWVLSN